MNEALSQVLFFNTENVDPEIKNLFTSFTLESIPPTIAVQNQFLQAHPRSSTLFGCCALFLEKKEPKHPILFWLKLATIHNQWQAKPIPHPIRIQMENKNLGE